MAAPFPRVLLGLTGGLLGTTGVAFCEAKVALQAQGQAEVRLLFELTLAEIGVLAPLALGVGAAVSAVSLFIEPERPISPLERLAALRALPVLVRSRVAALAPLLCIAATAWLVVVAHSARSLLRSGTPIASGVALAVLSLGWLVALACGVLACLPPTRRGLALAAAKWPRAVDPLATASAGLVFAAVVLSIGAYHGDTGGEGSTPLAIFGVLKRSELDLRPVVNLAVIAACAWGIPLAASGRGRSFSVGAVSTVVLVGALAATVYEASALERAPAAARAIERHAPLGRIALALDRKATDRDRDGASPYFGGGDCNDHDPRISPLAVEIPGNGIDEDCSGADLPRAQPAIAATAAPAVKASVASDMNLILITIDALRASEVGFLGYDKPTTPNLDALASESVVFDRAYAMASYTGKALAPMLIGKYPCETIRDGGHFTRYLAGNTFLAERLRAAGIFTMGAASHWYFRPYFGLTQGFDAFDLSPIPGTGQGEGDTSVTSPRLTDAALELLAAHAATGRFFLWVHYFDPHAQYVPHEGTPDFYDPSRGRMRALYDGEVWFTDKAAGRLLDYVKTQPWAQRTIIVVTSDHGESMNDHGMGYQHGFEIWEPLVRVPLVLEVPGLRAHHVQVKRSAVDLVPTLLDLMHVAQPAPGELSGVSLVADLAAERADDYQERDVYLDMPEGPHTHMRRGIIHGPTPGMKLIHFGGRQFQLYDLDADPGEMHDVAGNAERLEPMLRAFSAKRETLSEIYVAPDSTLP